MEDMGKMLILLGIILAIIGSVLIVMTKVPALGKLPGDIVIERDNISCVFPLATSILLSIVLTIVLNLILRMINK